MNHDTQHELAQRFHALHHAPELLILPNAWDAGSAVIFERAGFSAIGTTSAGIAYTLGYPDGQQTELADVIYTVRNIMRRIQLPLTVDVESGYGTTPAEIAENIRQVIEAGAVGINLEDSRSGTEPALIPVDEQCRRIEAVAALKSELAIPFFINARTDVYLLNTLKPENRLAAAVERGTAYVTAGGDGVFVPGYLQPDTILELVQRINAPLNVLAMPANPSLAALRELRAARLSIGSGAVRAVLGLAQKIATELRHEDSLANMFNFATPYNEMNQLFE